jgi:hypothetical protein
MIRMRLNRFRYRFRIFFTILVTVFVVTASVIVLATNAKKLGNELW